MSQRCAADCGQVAFSRVIGRLAAHARPLLDLLFPPLCTRCRGALISEAERGHSLCASCLSGVNKISRPWCSICGEPFASPSSTDHLCSACIKKPPSFSCHRSLFWYKGTVKDLICDLKFRGRLYCLNSLAALARHAMTRQEIWPLEPRSGCSAPDGPVVVPIPISSSRLRQRGFNQALLLARQIFPDSSISWRLLEKVKETEPQASLSLQERRKNIKGAFRSSKKAKGRRILLIDDVYTSGSTMEEAARSLMASGARQVAALTLARTPFGAD